MANLSIGMLIKPDADDEVIEEAVALVCKRVKKPQLYLVGLRTTRLRLYAMPGWL